MRQSRRLIHTRAGVSRISLARHHHVTGITTHLHPGRQLCSSFSGRFFFFFFLSSSSSSHDGGKTDEFTSDDVKTRDEIRECREIRRNSRVTLSSFRERLRPRALRELSQECSRSFRLTSTRPTPRRSVRPQFEREDA